MPQREDGVHGRGGATYPPPAASRLCLPRRACLVALGAACCQPATTGRAARPRLLFASGFEGDISLAPPYGLWRHALHQDVVGLDSNTGYTWPAELWGGRTSIQLLTDGPGGAISNSIESVTGHDGSATRALHLAVNSMQPGGVTQSPLLLTGGNPTSDFYISQWVKLPSNLGRLLGRGGWMSGFGEWKTAGDFRVISGIIVDGDGKPIWEMKWDNMAGHLPRQTFWRHTNSRVPVPQGEWMHVEFFTRRGNTDGRVWLKVDGQTVFDHTGDNIGVNNDPIDRIFLANAYGSKPVDIWVDDLEIWDGAPA